MKQLLSFLILILSFTAHANSKQNQKKNVEENEYVQIAEEMAAHHIRVDPLPTPHLVIEGDIAAGDFKTFLNKVKESGPEVSEVTLFSRGGDATEAMKIGRLIRDLGFSTNVSVFDLPGKGRKCVPETKFAEDCNCASSCFLIYAGGINRGSANVLGVHRIFADHDALAKFSPTVAMKIAKDIKEETKSYLQEMGIEDQLITKIFTIPSDDIVYLSEKELESLKGDIYETQEWIKAKCAKEQKYESVMKALFKKKTNGTATKEELKKLSGDPQFYKVLAGCKIDARKELRKERRSVAIKKAEGQ